MSTIRPVRLLSHGLAVRTTCTTTTTSRHRSFTTSLTHQFPPAPPKTKDRGPTSKEETQTDFNVMDMFSNMAAPTTAVDACMEDGFALNSGLKVTGAGVLLVAGEAFKWRPWSTANSASSNINEPIRGEHIARMTGRLRNAKGQFDVDAQVWGILDLIWPKPDLLILGTGSGIIPLSPETRKHLSELGVRVEVQDTRNAAAQYNLLATERGVHQIASALVPIGWREKR